MSDVIGYVDEADYRCLCICAYRWYPRITTSAHAGLSRRITLPSHLRKTHHVTYSTGTPGHSSFRSVIILLYWLTSCSYIRTKTVSLYFTISDLCYLNEEKRRRRLFSVCLSVCQLGHKNYKRISTKHCVWVEHDPLWKC